MVGTPDKQNVSFWILPKEIAPSPTELLGRDDIIDWDEQKNAAIKAREILRVFESLSSALQTVLTLLQSAETERQQLKHRLQNLEVSLGELKERLPVAPAEDAATEKRESSDKVAIVPEKQLSTSQRCAQPKRLSIKEFCAVALDEKKAKTTLLCCNELKVVAKLDVEETGVLRDNAVYDMTLSAKHLGQGKKRKSWSFRGMLTPLGVIEAIPNQLEQGWYRFAVSLTFTNKGGEVLPFVAFEQSGVTNIQASS